MFKEFLEKHNLQEKNIAVGVSGGSDSLALALMLNDELTPLGYKIIALTVDHRLRPSSAQEALYVSQIMQAKNIEHHTLVWESNHPQTGIEEASRIARYRLLEDWCKQHQIHYLMTAHHLNDQIETFFMRLQRGSGLDGLCGMKEVFEKNNFQILRPLLYTLPEVMKNYLLKNDIRWVEDESNACEDFLRVKIRHFLPDFYQKTGISPHRIGQTMQRLWGSRNHLENETLKIVKNNFKNWYDYGYSCSVDNFTALDDELKFRIMAYLLKKVGKDQYPPRAERILSLIEKITPDFKSATLGHCHVSVYNKKLWIFPEFYTLGQYTPKLWQDFTKTETKYKNLKLPLRLKIYLYNLFGLQNTKNIL